MVFIDPLVYFVFMVREQEKYVAYSFNIAGFALVSPLGKIILDALEIYEGFRLSWFFIGYIVFCTLLAIIGVWSIFYGRGILNLEREKKR